MGWQPLMDHLRGVADRAQQFCDAFNAGKAGRLVGLLHDLGKYQEPFQRRLAGEALRVEHSGAGAVAVTKAAPKELGEVLAFAIAGHHSGMPDVAASDRSTPLEERLRNNAPLFKQLERRVPEVHRIYEEACSLTPLPIPAWRKEQDSRRHRRAAEFWGRMVFSALVDADRLDAEEFQTPEKASLRKTPQKLSELLECLDAYLDRLTAWVNTAAQDTAVNLVRKQVLEACKTNASSSQGIYKLTVPTGGGKTLSALRFALGHAVHHGLARVISVMPYTSIIEQNAAVYREALGSEAVVEHHSALSPETLREQLEPVAASRHELACENWDAPVIVTTTVQLLESLFSNSPTRCRKLHNIANSVLILDEIQTLPPAFLEAIVDALQELVDHYGCTLLLATATQPALAKRIGSQPGLRNVHELVQLEELQHQAMSRVVYEWRCAESKAITWRELAAELAQQPQVLAIVHARQDARELTQEVAGLVNPEESFHLSALMCPAHRSSVLATVRQRLAQNQPCRLISTQLVEAGVDLDFPVVYRALAGLDSIVQAAGRCNREGKLDAGRCIIFRAPTQPPPGTLRTAAQITATLLASRGGALAPTAAEVVEDYFLRLYSACDTDAKQVQKSRERFNYAETAARFRLIEDGCTRSLVVPWKGARGHLDALLETLKRDGPTRELLRSLQPYTVRIWPSALEKLLFSGQASEYAGVVVLCDAALYDEQYGLRLDKLTQAAKPLLI